MHEHEHEHDHEHEYEQEQEHCMSIKEGPYLRILSTLTVSWKLDSMKMARSVVRLPRSMVWAALAEVGAEKSAGGAKVGAGKEGF